jgi:hypothetical protein
MAMAQCLDYRRKCKQYIYMVMTFTCVRSDHMEDRGVVLGRVTLVHATTMTSIQANPARGQVTYLSVDGLPNPDVRWKTHKHKHKHIS